MKPAFLRRFLVLARRREIARRPHAEEVARAARLLGRGRETGRWRVKRMTFRRWVVWAMLAGASGCSGDWDGPYCIEKALGARTGGDNACRSAHNGICDEPRDGPSLFPPFHEKAKVKRWKTWTVP